MQLKYDYNFEFWYMNIARIKFAFVPKVTTKIMLLHVPSMQIPTYNR